MPFPKLLVSPERGNIAFFSTYRPPVPFQIYSRPAVPVGEGEPSSPRMGGNEEVEMIKHDGISYNYNGHVIPPSALKTIIRCHKPRELAGMDDADVDLGKVTGLVFVSERTDGLETLHVAFRWFRNKEAPRQKVYNLADLFGPAEFSVVRMEDSACFAGGEYLVYVSTKEPASRRRQPWTAVYKTSLKDGSTHRITPQGTADLSPAVSPSGKKIAVASFQKKGGWDGEIEDLKTAIYVVDIDEPQYRTMVIGNGGWPTWGSEEVLFFHRYEGGHWGVFKVDLSDGKDPYRVTPEGIDAMTPAAIDTHRVAVTTLRKQFQFGQEREDPDQYRHIEIFDSSLGPEHSVQLTKNAMPMVDHYNPFVVLSRKGSLKRIGYHRCRDHEHDDCPSQIDILKSPIQDIGACRVGGAFPSFSKNRKDSKMALVDNDFKHVYIVDQGKPFMIYQEPEVNVFAPVWNQNPEEDTLYICRGTPFSADKAAHICVFKNICDNNRKDPQPLTLPDKFNDAFPSTNAQGTKLVFRSTRCGGGGKYKNLYIMEDPEVGEYNGGTITRLTKGQWTDTHCEWSPNEDWIVFSSTRDKPESAPESDNNLDPGYFSVFIVNANKPDTVIRVLTSGDNLAGHVNHPYFSPDGKSIVVTSDLAGVSVDPVCLPHFLHSVRPYGDMFMINIDLEELSKKLEKNSIKAMGEEITIDVGEFTRITHSRYENSLASWFKLEVDKVRRACDFIYARYKCIGAVCPYVLSTGGHSLQLTGHLLLPNRLC